MEPKFFPKCRLLVARLPDDPGLTQVQTGSFETCGYFALNRAFSGQSHNAGDGRFPWLVFQRSPGHEPCEISQAARLIHGHELSAEIEAVPPTVVKRIRSGRIAIGRKA